MSQSSLVVDPDLRRFIEDALLPGTGLSAAKFFAELESALRAFTPVNAALLSTRDSLQAEIDGFHLRGGANLPVADQIQFLHDIGYLEPDPPSFQIETTGVDPEIAKIAGPQLVVPLSNARYAVNAANARWGSLYDAMYGSDVFGEPPKAGAYDAGRGLLVIAYGRAILDRHFPLVEGSHGRAVRYSVEGGALRIGLRTGETVALRDPTQWVGWRGDATAPSAILLVHNGLHVEILIDRDHPIGAGDAAGVCDLILEAAITTIQDCEDSVAAVDAEDKIAVYRTWLGLMKGDMAVAFARDGIMRTRNLNPDRCYQTPDGELTLSGRSLMWVRHVGAHLLTDAVLLNGAPIYETVLDAFVTVAAALHDLRGARRNSRTGAIYVVKPKLHGPQEVALAVRLFERIEAAFDLPPLTVKLGLMDEERRTSANLAACIFAAHQRLAFINTGFLDRTGDEIHTAMAAGPVVRKADMKASRWFGAYESRNVAIGLSCGLDGRAQIGKGMWAAPDRMGDMLREKIAHPLSGASTAWAPSPTAATLHALHYHEADVAAVRAHMGRPSPADLTQLLELAVLQAPPSREAVREELENNAQGVLGYVVRWVDQGIGCSKVPDLHDIGLMEDRATLRISSQHIANWLKHGICTEAEVRETFVRMAAKVDAQNASDPAYRPMCADLDGNLAFQAALRLALEGASQPNGYTEFILTAARRAKKAQG